MGVDFTNARVDGKSAQVAVCASPTYTMYFAREHKGHEGVRGTPAETHCGTLVHDHDATFHNYGARHQGCLAHVLRYLKDSMNNEPNLTWNKEMHGLLQNMIRAANEARAKGCRNLGSDVVSGFEARYTEVLVKARGEYEYEPPSDYYKNGYNLYKRLGKYKDSHLLFLYDLGVPADNNRCGRKHFTHNHPPVWLELPGGVNCNVLDDVDQCFLPGPFTSLIIGSIISIPLTYNITSQGGFVDDSDPTICGYQKKLQ
ncbi:MAG: transposase [Lachnospiraceae bacterium]|jgi:hypothetical protein|nr:transposase [Lachnospiraceae bacterium]